MAIATLNPFLVSISGRIGCLVFYPRKKKQCIRMYVVPRNPDTILQRNVRRSFADAVKSWQALTTEEKYKYIRRARGTNMSGYNLYISEYIKETISTRSNSELKISFQDLLYSSGVQRHIHSVSASLLKAFSILTTGKQLFPGHGST